MSDPTVTFQELALAAPILQAITEVGYEAPSPIQAATIPPLLEGRDLIGQAQTGTGKTAAFALPLLSRVDVNNRLPQVLVLAPTRELAIQVAEAFQTYARHLKGFHVLPIYGGQDMQLQLRHLKRGAQVIVGTPGRVMDHLRRRSLDVSSMQAIVLDEADEMLKMGFIDDVEWILEQLPEQRQVALFSATMPKVIRDVADRYLRNPEVIKIQTKTSTVDTITQRYIQVNVKHKLDVMTRILEVEDIDAAIVFVRTKNATVELAEKLEARGYASAPLNGDMNQALREKTVERLKQQKLDIVIATDVAARGLDVARLSHVINYDIPNDIEAYVHRIGRTGRAGRSGEAILFVTPREMRMLHSIEKVTRQPITAMKPPSREEITDRRITRFKQTISDTIEAQELGFFENLMAQYVEEHDFDPVEVAAALAYLVQQERPLEAAAGGMAENIALEEPRGRHDTRPPRGGERRERSFGNEVEAGMIRYRMDVGRDHGVQPKHIVGAIANEAGIDSKNIGHIKLYDDYSTVDLPDGMPPEVFKHLQGVRVLKYRMNLRRLEAGGKSKYVAKSTKDKGKPKHKKKKDFKD